MDYASSTTGIVEPARRTPHRHQRYGADMNRALNDGDVVSMALADAFLVGAWTIRSMTERAASVYRQSPPLTADLRTLATAVRRRYATAPRDRPAELARFITLRIAVRNLVSLTRRGDGIAWKFAPVTMGRSAWPVPPITSIDELANGFGVTVGQLRWLADERGLEQSVTDERLRNYVYRWNAKGGNRWRLIEAPKDRLKKIQRILLIDVLGSVPVHERAFGFVRGRSAVDAAACHVARDVVIRIDLEDFFTTIPRAKVAAIFRTIGYPEPIARLFAALTTNQTPTALLRDERLTPTMAMKLRTPHLPQGAPSSPTLANLAAYRLDCRLSGLATSFRFTYTRYADDLVFSGDRLSSTRLTSLLGLMQAIIEDEGFVVNHHKTKVMASSARQQVTGIVVNDRLNVARAERDALRAILHNCSRSGPQPQNTDELPDFRAHLLGRISWVAHCNPDAGERLRESFARINWDESTSADR